MLCTARAGCVTPSRRAAGSSGVCSRGCRRRRRRRAAASAAPPPTGWWGASATGRLGRAARSPADRRASPAQAQCRRRGADRRAAPRARPPIGAPGCTIRRLCGEAVVRHAHLRARLALRPTSGRGRLRPTPRSGPPRARGRKTGRRAGKAVPHFGSPHGSRLRDMPRGWGAARVAREPNHPAVGVTSTRVGVGRTRCGAWAFGVQARATTPQAVGKERKHASRPVGRERGHNGARTRPDPARTTALGIELGSSL
jgi:hypothetical protein